MNAILCFLYACWLFILGHHASAASLLAVESTSDPGCLRNGTCLCDFKNHVLGYHVGIFFFLLCTVLFYPLTTPSTSQLKPVITAMKLDQKSKGKTGQGRVLAPLRPLSFSFLLAHSCQCPKAWVRIGKTALGSMSLEADNIVLLI